MNKHQELILQLSAPLEPKPTGVEPKTGPIQGVQAVMFDVYGTMLVSACGDISLADKGAHGGAAAAALGAIGATLHVDGQRIVERLHAEIETLHHALIAPGEQLEVDITDVWETIVDEAATAGELELSDNEPSFERLAIEYECRVNPIWPMPGLVEALSAVRDAGLPMGIISNAQFFTPQSLEALTGRSLVELGFSPELCIWSYAHRRAKPDMYLYRKGAEALAARGIEPAAVLYLGNDVLKDIWPARRIGFSTALFAGDARSLRLHEREPNMRAVSPDAVITDLRQLRSVLSLAGD